MQALPRALSRFGLLGAPVVPGGPGGAALRQHRGVGVQHGAVGLVPMVSSTTAFCAGCASSARLVERTSTMVEMFGALVEGLPHACGVALDAARGVQAFVGHAYQNFST